MPVRNFDPVSAGDPVEDFFSEERIQGLQEAATKSVAAQDIRGGPGVFIRRGENGVTIRVRRPRRGGTPASGHPFKLEVGRNSAETWVRFQQGNVGSAQEFGFAGVYFNGFPMDDPSAIQPVAGTGSFVAYLRNEFVGFSVNLAATGSFFITDTMALASSSIHIAASVPISVPLALDRAVGTYEDRVVDGISTTRGVFFQKIASFTIDGSGGDVAVAVTEQSLTNHQWAVYRHFSNVLFVPVGVVSL